jgi:hypothetical protein
VKMRDNAQVLRQWRGGGGCGQASIPLSSLALEMVQAGNRNVFSRGLITFVEGRCIMGSEG